MTKADLIEQIIEKLEARPMPSSFYHNVARGGLAKLNVTELDAIDKLLTRKP